VTIGLNTETTRHVRNDELALIDAMSAVAFDDDDADAASPLDQFLRRIVGF
jgi:hypothetical protein